MGSSTDVLDLAASHRFIGDDRLVSVEQSQSGRAQSDLLDDSVKPVDDHPFADAERFVEDDHDAAEEIFQGILRGQSEGKSSDTRTCQKSGKGDAQVLTALEEDDDGGDKGDDSADDPDQLGVESFRFDLRTGDQNFTDPATCGDGDKNQAEEKDQCGGETDGGKAVSGEADLFRGEPTDDKRDKNGRDREGKCQEIARRTALTAAPGEAVANVM